MRGWKSEKREEKRNPRFVSDLKWNGWELEGKRVLESEREEGREGNRHVTRWML